MIAIITLFGECLWYFPLFFRQGKLNACPKKYSLYCALVGMTLGFLVGVFGSGYIGMFLRWAFGLEKDTTLYYLLYDFLAVAIAEETAKFFCGWLFVKKAKPVRKLDYIFIFGASALGFTLIESFCYSDGLISIGRALFPFHIMWQFHMGEHLFEAKCAKDAGDKKLQRKETAIAFLVPILMHGANDFFVDIFAKATEGFASISTEELAANGGMVDILKIAVPLIWVIIVMPIYVIVKERHVAKLVKQSREDDKLAAAEAEQ